MTAMAATRSSAQNRFLHALLRDIAAQAEWAGARRSADVWKRLLLAAWLRARGEYVELLPAVDGEGIDIVYHRTSKLSPAECSEMCEWILAWCAHRSIAVRESEVSA